MGAGRGSQSWLYNRDLFERWRMEQMARHYVRVLEAMVADAEEAVGRVDLLGTEERQQILVKWNETEREVPEATLPTLFEEQVERTPEMAVVFEEEPLSYGELNRKANQLARHLRSLCGFQGQVGIFVNRSIKMVIGDLASIKAGASCVPLDPSYPEERIRFMMEDAEMAVVLTQSHLRASLGECMVPIVCLDIDHGTIARYADANPDFSVGLDDLLYIIYTSGSTGRPKSIGLTPRVMANLLAWHQSELMLAARTLQYAPLSFDASFHEILSALCSGGSVFLIEEDRRRDVAGLAEFIDENRIEKIILPVVVVEQLAQEFLRRGSPLPQLRELIFPQAREAYRRQQSVLIVRFPARRESLI